MPCLRILPGHEHMRRVGPIYGNSVSETRTCQTNACLAQHNALQQSVRAGAARIHLLPAEVVALDVESLGAHAQEQIWWTTAIRKSCSCTQVRIVAASCSSGCVGNSSRCASQVDMCCSYELGGAQRISGDWPPGGSRVRVGGGVAAPSCCPCGTCEHFGADRAALLAAAARATGSTARAPKRSPVSTQPKST